MPLQVESLGEALARPGAEERCRAFCSAPKDAPLRCQRANAGQNFTAALGDFGNHDGTAGILLFADNGMFQTRRGFATNARGPVLFLFTGTALAPAGTLRWPLFCCYIRSAVKFVMIKQIRTPACSADNFDDDQLGVGTARHQAERRPRSPYVRPFHRLALRITVCTRGAVPITVQYILHAGLPRPS